MFSKANHIYGEYKIYAFKRRFSLTKKEQFIHLIGDKLTKDGYTVHFAEEDVEIVKASLDASLTNNVTLIGEDTDLLVLLLLIM